MATSLWGWFSGAGRSHRKFGPHEEQFVRLATRKRPAPLEHDRNPGVRVEPGFVVGPQAQQVVEAAMAIVREYGISHVDDEQREFYGQQMKRVPGWPEDGSNVNMLRVTGRYESGQQKLAPWGYGDEFNVDKVPAPLREVLERIKGCGSFSLGHARDITINYRRDYFFRLDPHVDPSADGGNVFILGLLSGAVLTLSPPHPTFAEKQFLHMDQRRVAEQSWQPGKDVDVDLAEGALLHLSGDARDTWNHGIRPGVSRLQLEALGMEPPPSSSDPPIPPPTASGPPPSAPVLYDWFGSVRDPRVRGPERLSIIFAFSDP